MVFFIKQRQLENQSVALLLACVLYDKHVMPIYEHGSRSILNAFFQIAGFECASVSQRYNVNNLLPSSVSKSPDKKDGVKRRPDLRGYQQLTTIA